MSIYYISCIEENTVKLAPVKYYEHELTLGIDLLEDFAKENTIIGYNPVTKKVSLKTLADVMNNLNSKLRLIGITTGKGIEVEGTLFKEVNNVVYYMHELKGKIILVAEPLVEYNNRVEYRDGKPYRNVRDIKLTMPDSVEKNVDIIRLNWGNILTPAVYVSNVSILDITIDFPFTSKVIGFNPLIKFHSMLVKDIIFTENFSMKNANVNENAFNMVAEFKNGEIVQTKDGYRLLSESIGKWFYKRED